MAQSRLEKIGTIYTRTQGLIKAGALQWHDRPLWYDLYEAFPPKETPQFARPASLKAPKAIFYEEDKIRATFHRNNKQIGTVNLSNSKTKALTQRFIEKYQLLEAQYKKNETSEEKLYVEAIEELRRVEKVDEEPISLSVAFREAQKKKADKKPSLDLSNIFTNN